jgi:hypothetical protein
VCVPIPVGLGISRAAITINERQAAQIASHRIRPHAPTVTGSMRGEKMGGVCEESIAAKYRVGMLITMASAQRLGNGRSEAAVNFQTRYSKKTGVFFIVYLFNESCYARVQSSRKWMLFARFGSGIIFAIWGSWDVATGPEYFIMGPRLLKWDI